MTLLLTDLDAKVKGQMILLDKNILID